MYEYICIADRIANNLTLAASNLQRIATYNCSTRAPTDWHTDLTGCLSLTALSHLGARLLGEPSPKASVVVFKITANRALTFVCNKSRVQNATQLRLRDTTSTLRRRTVSATLSSSFLSLLFLQKLKNTYACVSTEYFNGDTNLLHTQCKMLLQRSSSSARSAMFYAFSKPRANLRTRHWQIGGKAENFEVQCVFDRYTHTNTHKYMVRALVVAWELAVGHCRSFARSVHVFDPHT